MIKLVIGIQGDCQFGNIESFKRSQGGFAIFDRDSIEIKNLLNSIGIRTSTYTGNISYMVSLIVEEIEAVTNFMEVMEYQYLFVAGKDWSHGKDLIKYLN